MIYLSADHHFNHGNIIKLCRRPFKNIDEMNNELISLWNNVVRPEDIVFYLGDFGFEGRDKLKDICRRLNGSKLLIKGNHDKKISNSTWRLIGFEDIYENMQLDKILFTHKPAINLLKGIMNVHGHIHNGNISQINGYKAKNQFCVSVECTDYKPISLEVIKNKFKGKL